MNKFIFKFRKIIHFILNLYLPVWLRVKFQPHIQDGSKHFHYMVELSQGMEVEAMTLVHKVLGDNAHFAHPESIVISLLADPTEELRRREFDQQKIPRQFIPPTVNFQEKVYADLVDLDSVVKTEPPLTKDISEDTLLSAMASPLHLPSYPNHTQKVEQYMPVLEQACGQRVGHTARDRLILSLNKSRSLVPIFNTKKQDSKF